jgi:hypothetical protein
MFGPASGPPASKRHLPSPPATVAPAKVCPSSSAVENTSTRQPAQAVPVMTPVARLAPSTRGAARLRLPPLLSRMPSPPLREMLFCEMVFSSALSFSTHTPSPRLKAIVLLTPMVLRLAPWLM